MKVVAEDGSSLPLAEVGVALEELLRRTPLPLVEVAAEDAFRLSLAEVVATCRAALEASL